MFTLLECPERNLAGFTRHLGSACTVNQPHDLFPRDNNQFSRKNKAKPIPLVEDPAARAKSFKEVTCWNFKIISLINFL